MAEESRSISYEQAGVDITAGYRAVELMKTHIARTKRQGVVEGVGGFGGLFQPDLTGMKQPIFVSGTDGVGTKLKIAFLMDKHDTVGIDCVAMCANDIACCGADPLFFLDYIALGKNIPEKVAKIVSGIAEGCVQAESALIGGETAEMPGMYGENEYDLAGFSVGVADKEKLYGKNRVREGDALIGLASSGVHSNGFSLVRKVFNVNEETIGVYYDELGKTLGEELLTPTKIYVKALKTLKLSLAEGSVHACSHITGGGFYENVPRSIPDSFCAVIEKSKLEIPPIFSVLQKAGDIPEHDMFNTYNMGCGMVIALDREQADAAVRLLEAEGQKAAIIGEVTRHKDERIILS